MKSRKLNFALVIIITLLMMLSLTAQPAQAQSVTVSPSSGPVGTTITVSGSGFQDTTPAATYWITFAYGNLTFAREIGRGTVASGGVIPPTSFVVPEIPKATYTIQIATSTGEAKIISFDVAPKITLAETSGFVGDESSVSGTGFAANSDITVYFGNEAVGTGVRTGANGSFSNAIFTVPESYNGSHTIKAQDASANFTTGSFSTKQSMTIAPTTGASGASVTISGAGFRARRAMTITFSNLPVTTSPPTITTDDYGSFSGTFLVPAVARGDNAVQASDGTNKASVDFKASAGATINQTTGNVGTEIIINGTGFTIGTKISITYDGKEQTTATPDSNGTFRASFKVPASQHGSHTVSAIDTTNPTNTKAFTFTMESTPPPVPALQLPEEGAKANKPVQFDWDDVQDPSGVTYTFQLATNNKFTSASIVLERKELTESEYTPTEEEELEPTKKEAPYFWRVKAIDSASNESAWSTTGSFYTGFQWPELKGWLLYILIGIGAVLFLFLGFWLGRKTTYY